MNIFANSNLDIGTSFIVILLLKPPQWFHLYIYYNLYTCYCTMRRTAAHKIWNKYILRYSFLNIPHSWTITPISCITHIRVYIELKSQQRKRTAYKYIKIKSLHDLRCFSMAYFKMCAHSSCRMCLIHFLFF